VAFLCLPVITGIYATYLLTKNTNMAIEFESKHGLKLINFPTLCGRVQMSTSTYIHLVTEWTRQRSRMLQSPYPLVIEWTRQGTRMLQSPYSLITEWTRQENSLYYPILSPILLLEMNSCFAHAFVA
jgi:hypothetical protein